jgi:hypothetical protein
VILDTVILDIAPVALADSGVVAVIPAVDTTDQIPVLDVAIPQQDTTVLAATVGH